MILGYVIWGDKTTYAIETAFSILTFLSDPAIDEICVLTEKPEYLALFRNHDKVKIIHVSQEEFAEWFGTPRYIFRAKIKGLQRLVELYPGRDILYVDTDTFRGRALAPVQEHLAKGGLGMSDRFGDVDVTPNNSGTPGLWNMAKNLNLPGIALGTKGIHYNSGCIGLPGGKAREIVQNALRLNDALVAQQKGAPLFLTEEFAYSVVLMGAGEVMDLNEQVGHYYGNKKTWQSEIREFFTASRVKGNTVEDDLREIAHFAFKAIPIGTHIPSWRRRVNAFMLKILPDKRVRFF